MFRTALVLLVILIPAIGSASTFEGNEHIRPTGALDGHCFKAPRTKSEAPERFIVAPPGGGPAEGPAVDIDCVRSAFSGVELRAAAAKSDLVAQIALIVRDDRRFNDRRRCGQAMSFGRTLARRQAQVPELVRRELLLATDRFRGYARTTSSRSFPTPHRLTWLAWRIGSSLPTMLQLDC